jgi:membrane protease YdiL (CAAX protease family)
MTIEEHLISAIVGLFLGVFVVLIAWRLRYFKLPESQPTVKMAFKFVVGAFLIYLITELLVIPAFIVVTWFFLKHPTSIMELENALDLASKAWINLASLTTVTILLVLYCYSIGPTLRKLIWNSNHKDHNLLRKDFLLGVVTWVISFPLVVSVENLTILLTSYLYPNFTKPIDQVAVKYLKALAEIPSLYWLTALVLCTCIPVVEEMLFRGFFQTWIKGWLGRGKAIIVTSLCFALMHFSTSQGISNLDLMLALFVLSCFLGFLYERQRSLWAPIGLHATFNAISILSFNS